MTFRFLRGLTACVMLLLAFACKDALDGSGGTTGVALYAFDSTTSTVMVWDDLGALYDATATPSPDRTISSNLLSKVTNLGWGGFCLDSQRNLVYLASDAGTIVRISRIRTQTGTVPNTDIASFTLSSSDRLTNGKFGQAALDVQNDTLYVTENGDNGTRIWVVTNASTQLQDNSIPLQALQVSGDSGGTGVAAGSGNVYAYMEDGNPVGPDLLTGPRLRRGNLSAFEASGVILGQATGLEKYGSLALDTANSYLFVARHITDAGGAGKPIQVFRTGQFGLAYDQAPAYSIGSATDQADLRVLAHSGAKDWLVGLRGQGTVGYATLILWKSPLGGVAAKAVTVSPATTVFRGVAMDGNAS